MHVHRWFPSPWATGFIALFALVSAALLPWLTTDMNIDRMQSSANAAKERYDAFRAAYGHDEFVLIAVSGGDLFAPEALDAMIETFERLEEDPHVGRVSGIPQVFLNLFGGEDIEGLREELTSTPFYRNFFIARDESMTGIVVEAVELEAPGARRQFLDAVEAAAQPIVDAGYAVDMIGATFIAEAIQDYSRQEVARFFPIAVAASLLIMYVLLRSLRAVAVVLVCALTAILLVMGTLIALGRPLNVVTMSFPLILWMLTLANGIHLVARFQFFLSRGQSRHDAVKASLRDVALPCLLSGVTTAFGFIALATADLPPIREFGLVMALGMLYAVLVNLALGSQLLLWFRARTPRWMPPGDGHPFRVLATWTLRRPWGILLVFGVLIALGLYSLTQVRTERSTLSFLPDHAPEIDSFYRVAERLTGIYTLEILLDTPEGWLTPEYWPAIVRVQEDLDALEHVARVVSPLDYLRKLHQWDRGPDAVEYRLPETAAEAQRLVEMAAADSGGEALKRFVRGDGRQVRLTALLNTADALHFQELRRETLGLLAKLPPGMSGSITGRADQSAEMQAELVDSQRRSFSLAFLLVFITIYAGLRSLQILAISVVPNLMPIVSTFTILVVLDIPLDAGTVMVASIALGIAVDDTVHLLSAFKRHREKGAGSRLAIVEALGDVGPAISVTSITASVGFFILAASIFKPLSYFGLASGIAIIIAWLADLFFVPALLAVFAPSKKPHDEATVNSTPGGAS